MDVMKEEDGQNVTSNGIANYFNSTKSPSDGTECDTTSKSNGSTRGDQEEELRIGSPSIQLNDKAISDDSEMKKGNVVMNNSGDQANSGRISRGSANIIKTSSDEIIVAINGAECPMDDIIFNGNQLTEESKSASVPALTPTMFDSETDQEGETSGHV